MSIQTDFTVEEWNTLLQAPGFAVLFIIQADQSRREVAYQKMFAGIKAIITPDKATAHSQLVQGVREAFITGQRPCYPSALPHDVPEARQIALEGCRQAAILLAQRVPDDEAECYNRWLLALATFVGAAVTSPTAQVSAALATLAATLQSVEILA